MIELLYLFKMSCSAYRYVCLLHFSYICLILITVS